MRDSYRTRRKELSFGPIDGMYCYSSGIMIPTRDSKLPMLRKDDVQKKIGLYEAAVTNHVTYYYASDRLKAVYRPVERIQL